MFGQQQIIPFKTMTTDPDRGATYQRVAQTMPTSTGDRLLPGAAIFPPSIARRLTVRNGLIGAGAVVASYLVYALLKPRKKAAATVSGWWKRRRRAI